MSQYVWKSKRADPTTLPHRIQKSYIPTTLEELIGRDLEEYKRKKEEEAGITTKTEENVDEDGTTTTTTTTTTTKLETVVVKEASIAKVDSKLEKKFADIPVESAPPTRINTPATNLDDDPNRPEVVENLGLCQQRGLGTTHVRGEHYDDEPPAPTVSPGDKRKVTVPHESSDDVVIGLRVYTHRDVACSVQGRLRREGMFM